MDATNPPQDESTPSQRLVQYEETYRNYLEGTSINANIFSVWYHIYRTNRQFLSRLDGNVLRPFGISFSGYVMLMTLMVTGDKALGELANIQGVSKAAVVQLANTLEKNHWIERIRSNTDRRRITIHLTPRGKQVIQKAQRAVHEFEQSATRNLTDEEMQTLTSILRKIQFSEIAGNDW